LHGLAGSACARSAPLHARACCPCEGAHAGAQPAHARFAARPLRERRKAITTYEDGEAEYDLVFKVISHMIKREGVLVVVTAPRKQAGEAPEAFRNRVWKERRLALSPSYVPE
jgi:hypothetical protein